jgi:hypothetical protein
MGFLFERFNGIIFDNPDLTIATSANDIMGHFLFFSKK